MKDEIPSSQAEKIQAFWADEAFQASHELFQKHGELKKLCARAADALAYEMMRNRSRPEIKDWSELIIELRKAAHGQQ